MTTVTITDRTIRAENHVGKTGVCIAVGAVIQNCSRILNEGRALASVEITPEPPVCEIVATEGMLAGPETDLAKSFEVMKRRIGRAEYIRAVFAGTAQCLKEIAEFKGHDGETLLEIIDERTDRPDERPPAPEVGVWPRLYAPNGAPIRA